jgi:hypothetical protein
MVVGENAFVGAHVANVGSQDGNRALVCSVSQWNTSPCDDVIKADVCKCPQIMSTTWHVYDTGCVSFVSVTDDLYVQNMKDFVTVIQSRLTDLLDSGLPYFQQNTVQQPQCIKKNPNVLVLSLLETVLQFLQGRWVGWKHNGIVIHNDFQALENKRVEGGFADTISVMDVQIRAPHQIAQGHVQLHVRRNVSPGFFVLTVVSMSLLYNRDINVPIVAKMLRKQIVDHDS